MNEGKKHLTDTVTSTMQTKIRPDTKNECWGEKQHVSVYSKILFQMLSQDPDRSNFKNTAIKLNGGFTWFIYLRIQKKNPSQFLHKRLLVRFRLRWTGQMLQCTEFAPQHFPILPTNSASPSCERAAVEHQSWQVKRKEENKAHQPMTFPHHERIPNVLLNTTKSNITWQNFKQVSSRVTCREQHEIQGVRQGRRAGRWHCQVCSQAWVPRWVPPAAPTTTPAQVLHLSSGLGHRGLNAGFSVSK